LMGRVHGWMDVSMYQSMDGRDITSFEGFSSIGLCEGAIEGVKKVFTESSG
jgi:hypothetical protein